ncbi:carotenoid ester lipase precursor [Gloeopeniophorella convolvens]|nr:carotenoid ester lipase precursor [Gloeopeniophorella convolvens]
MVHSRLLALVCVSLPRIVFASSSPPLPNLPNSVRLDNGLFVGNQTGNVTEFLGIPFAQPPVGNLRFQLPQPNLPYQGVHNATQFGPACIQQSGPDIIPVQLLDPTTVAVLEGGAGAPLADSEDCLSINVIKPTNIKSNQKLPVLVWIYGGGFEEGGTASFAGSVIVERSLALGEPVLYVSMNYRVSALGFLASEEVRKEGVGNLGLHDQRQALRWVQKYIHAFGGDPTKVTIWGESAGAISVASQMLTNGGHTEGLFRAAFMESGAPIPVGDLSHGQQVYDQFVAATNCSSAVDTLQCLREAPLSTIRAAQNASPFFFGFQSLDEAWLPRADGVFLPDDPQKLVLEGSVANIPFVSGNCDDEGTLFSLASFNITTDDEVRDYLRTFFLPTASNSSIDQLLTLYPSDPTVGSPFDTGTANAITPQFKRIAAILGDGIFQAPRRFFLQHRSGKQPIYSFLSKRFKTLPDLGAFHSTDLQNVYGPGDMTDYLIRFAATLNPNGKTNINWPRYTTQSPQLLTFLDGPTPEVITQDTYRAKQLAFMTQLFLENPI